MGHGRSPESHGTLNVLEAGLRWYGRPEKVFPCRGEAREYSTGNPSPLPEQSVKHSTSPAVRSDLAMFVSLYKAQFDFYCQLVRSSAPEEARGFLATFEWAVAHAPGGALIHT